MSNNASAHPPGELAKLADLAEAQDWELVKGRKHWRWTSPAGRTVTVQSTMGRGRAYANARSRLKAAGLELERPGKGRRRHAVHS